MVLKIDAVPAVACGYAADCLCEVDGVPPALESERDRIEAITTDVAHSPKC